MTNDQPEVTVDRISGVGAVARAATLARCVYPPLLIRRDQPLETDCSQPPTSPNRPAMPATLL